MEKFTLRSSRIFNNGFDERYRIILETKINKTIATALEASGPLGTTRVSRLRPSGELESAYLHVVVNIDKTDSVVGSWSIIFAEVFFEVAAEFKHFFIVSQVCWDKWRNIFSLVLDC